MIDPVRVAACEYILDRHNAVEILVDGIHRDPRGRPSNPKVLRLLLLGLILSIQNMRSATIRSAHHVLRTQLNLEDQIRIGFTRVENVDGEPKLVYVPETQFNDWIQSIKKHLNYGLGESPDLPDPERARRADVIARFAQAICDAFEDFHLSTAYAVDWTTLWSHYRGRKVKASTPKNATATDPDADTTTEEDLDDDDNSLAATDEITAIGSGPGITPAEVDPSLTGAPDEELDEFLANPPWIEALNHVPIDTGPPARRHNKNKRPSKSGKTRKRTPRSPAASFDRDARWGRKRSKTGRDVLVFGYLLHTLI
ncbi:MAG: hypothetical protein WCI50_14820, partial [Actinomycetes bacterium]